MTIREWLDKYGQTYARQDNMIRACSNATGCKDKSVKEVIAGYKYHNHDYEVCPTEEFRPLSNCREIVFAIASDLHFGSKACQITALKEFCIEAAKAGVKHILVPGDVVAGAKVYSGQDQDIYCSNAEDQENSVLANLPNGFEWYMLAGNHDYDYVKRSGHNPVEALALKRSDIHYIGADLATVSLMKGIDAQLWHPSGGVPYSYSYRLQKGIESFSLQSLHSTVTDKDPQVRFFIAGHLHIQMQGMFGQIFGCQAGAFEGTTGYLKRKGYFSCIGGYIVKATLKKDNIIKFEAPFVMFPDIKDDYKGYKHEYKEPAEDIKPLFGVK